MREAADHSCSESHQAENVSLKPYTTRWTNPVLSSALFVLGVHTAGVIVWSELKAYNTLTLFVLYKFWAFLLKKNQTKSTTMTFHLLHLKDWSASKICLLRETIFRLWNSVSDISNFMDLAEYVLKQLCWSLTASWYAFSPWMSLECFYLGSNITLPQGKL